MGGRTGLLVVGHGALTPVGPALSDAGSVFLMHIPEGAVVRYGIGPQVDAMALPDARAIMYPLAAGDWLFSLANQVQGIVRLVADGDADVPCNIMEAAVLGGIA